MTASWPPKPGDWVTGQSVMVPTGEMFQCDWNPEDPSEVQPGQTYQVDGMADEKFVRIPHRNHAFLAWLRPATPEEIALAKLAQLEGL